MGFTDNCSRQNKEICVDSCRLSEERRRALAFWNTVCWKRNQSPDQYLGENQNSEIGCDHILMEADSSEYAGKESVYISGSLSEAHGRLKYIVMNMNCNGSNEGERSMKQVSINFDSIKVLDVVLSADNLFKLLEHL